MCAAIFWPSHISCRIKIQSRSDLRSLVCSAYFSEEAEAGEVTLLPQSHTAQWRQGRWQPRSTSLIRVFL